MSDLTEAWIYSAHPSTLTVPEMGEALLARGIATEPRYLFSTERNTPPPWKGVYFYPRGRDDAHVLVTRRHETEGSIAELIAAMRNELSPEQIAVLAAARTCYELSCEPRPESTTARILVQLVAMLASSTQGLIGDLKNRQFLTVEDFRARFLSGQPS